MELPENMSHINLYGGSYSIQHSRKFIKIKFIKKETNCR